MKDENSLKMIITDGEEEKLIITTSDERSVCSQFEKIKKKFTKMTGRYYVDYDIWDC